MKTTIEISASLLRAAQRVAKRDGTSVRALVEHGLRLALAERRRTGPFRLRDASVNGDGLQSGMDGLSWEAQRALAYGDHERSKRASPVELSPAEPVEQYIATQARRAQAGLHDAD